MRGFKGFPQKTRLIQVPAPFFSDLLPQIDHLAELKVTLYCFWRLQQKQEPTPYIRLREILADSVFMSGFAPREDTRREVLLDGLERAVVRGTLLHAEAVGNSWQDDLYFVNTPRGRSAIEALEQGKWSPGPGEAVPFSLTVERPNIFTLYEQNIGPLTPMIADGLRDLEDTYPEVWVKEAIQLAVENNARKMSYITAILNRWQADGRARPDEDDDSDTPQKYLSGKYQDDIEY